MKKARQAYVIAALALLLTLSTAAQAALYVEGFLGGNAASNLGSGTPTFIGGWRLGYWFVPEGVLGINYPDWMKYFGFYTDISLNQVKVNLDSIQGTGYMATWAFVAAARYGFFPDKKVPFGRLQPWVGVGLADLVVRYPGESSSTATPALVVDAGVRYMLAPRFSISLGFRYRHAQPNITYNLFSGMAGLAYHF
jgi:hypothetical protein